MTYTPNRDSRFEYIWDLMRFIEENQCRTCAFSKLNDPDENRSHADEYPMCYEIEAAFIQEASVEALDDAGNDSVVCTKYKDVTLAGQEHTDQGRLF